jgi:bifunctional DNA-binding transcriptional regulator/antitoxin component of YhaV-PrlF toxin-antitoxin module
MAKNTDTTTVNTTVAKVQRHDVAGTQYVKPIELAKALGIKPQQVYGYIRKGKLESVIEPATGKQLVKLQSASDWVDAREARAAEREAQVAAELEGETTS